MKDHHVNVFYSDEDEGYIADIPDLRHCSAFGATPQEALAEVLKAKEAWIKAAKAAQAHPTPLISPRHLPGCVGYRSLPLGVLSGSMRVVISYANDDATD